MITDSFVLTPSVTDSLMTTSELLDISKWTDLGTLDTSLAESISDALTKLARLYIARQKKINNKFDSSKLEYYLTTLQQNLENTLSTWNDQGYSDLIKGIFGKNAAGSQIKKGKEITMSIREEIVASMPNTAQCKAAIIINNEKNRDRCWICGYSLYDYNPNGASRLGRNGKPENICPPNAIDCEHILGIKLALQHLNLVQISKKLYKQNTSSYKDILNLEYDMSHKCCNMHKLEIGFIRKEPVGTYAVDTQAIEGVLQNIYNDALVNNQKAYGCACIAMNDSGMRRVNQQLNRDRVIGRVQEIADVINAQINDISRLGVNINAALVYETFIKYRLLSRIPESKLIKAMLNSAMRISIPDDFLVKDRTRGGGKKIISESNQFGGTGVLSGMNFYSGFFSRLENKVDLILIWILNNISYEDIEFFEENGYFYASNDIPGMSLIFHHINDEISEDGIIKDDNPLYGDDQLKRFDEADEQILDEAEEQPNIFNKNTGHPKYKMAPLKAYNSRLNTTRGTKFQRPRWPIRRTNSYGGAKSKKNRKQNKNKTQKSNTKTNKSRKNKK